VKNTSLGLGVLAAWLLAGASGPVTAADDAVGRFLSAGDPSGAARRIDAVLKAGLTFDEVLPRLRRGRDYSSKVGRGRQQSRNGTDHFYMFVIPDNYDPARSYEVRVQLHGGVGRPQPPEPARLGVGRLPATVEEIEVFPAAWAQSLWWQSSQVDNLATILDSLKRTYNVDENRVYLTGISDGGTGVYFMAFRDTTPWASFLPLNGNMMVLATPEVGADGEMFPGNALNKPFFVVNGGRDHLYPAHLLQPYVEHLMRLGADVVFHVKTDSDHNTDWWPEERAGYEAFVDDHPRDPLPDRVTWETERVDRYNRAHWLVIDRLGDVIGQATLPDSNVLRRGEDAPPEVIFPRGKPSGRVDLERHGNLVEASTHGVRAFTLLLSPSKFDFKQPVRVVANGRTVYEGNVEPSVATLLKWAARDNDRTMLFGAELSIDLTK
jgi:hypothetical protein